MANTIKIKRSTGSAAPDSLAFGELAYSSGSGKLFFGSSTDGTNVTVTEIGGSAFTGYFSGVTPGTVAASKAVIVDAQKSVSGYNSVGLASAAFAGSTSGTATLAAPATAGTTSFTLPGTSGTLVGTGDTGSVSNGMLANSSVTVNSKSVSLGGTVTLVTDDVAESGAGATNKYFTDARARGSVSATTSGTGYGNLTYDSGTGAFTYAKVTTADIRGQFSAGTGVSITDGVVAIGQAVGTTDNVTFGKVTVGDGTTTGGEIVASNGTITIDPVALGNATGTVVIAGDLTVQGTTTTVNSTTVAIADLNFTLAKDATTAGEANGAGITVAGPATAATMTYASGDDSWNFNKQVKANVTGALTGNADTATKWATARDLSLTGDATATLSAVDGSAAVSATLTLATVNANVGSFGSSTAIPVVTVNAKGLVTAVTTASITTSLSVSAGTGSATVDLATDTLSIAGSGAIKTAATTVGTTDTVTVSIDDATTTTKGAASFAAANFDVTAGAVSVKAGGITATELASDAVTTAKIADGNVTAAKLATDSVETAKIVNSAVTTDKINNSAVTADKLATDSVTAEKMADSSVDLETATVTGTLPITNGGTGQTTASAAFDALSPTTTRGDLIARGASSNTRLALGGTKSVLVSNGTDPTWSNISFTNELFVSKGGNDTTGDGSFSNPYATITKAMTMVGTPTINDPMLIRVGSGRFTEPGALKIKPWVFIQGENMWDTRITPTSFQLDDSGTWLSSADHRAGIMDLTMNSSVTIDFLAVQSQQGKWYSNEVIHNSTTTLTAGYSVNQTFVQGGIYWGNVTFNGNQNNFLKVLFYGTVTVNQCSAAAVANHYLNLTHCYPTGNVTLNANNAALNNMPLSLIGSPVGGNLTINGTKGTLTVTSDSLPNKSQFTNTNNMTIYRKNDAYGVNMNSDQAGYWSSLGVNPYDNFSVQTALDALVVPVWNNKVNLRDIEIVTSNVTLPSTGDLTGYAKSVILVNAASGPITVTLPSSIDWEGKYWTIKKTDSSANAVTVTAPSGQTIDGSQSVVLTVQYEDITVIGSGTTTYARIQAAVTDGGTY